MPAVRFEEIRLQAPTGAPGKRTAFTSNWHKLRAWEKAVRDASEPVILADCDMLCLRSIGEAFDIGEGAVGGWEHWDIAYTQTSNPRLPLNGGLLFVRPTDASKRFFHRWREIDRQMYINPALHDPWRVKTAGMNQASFWYLHERELAALGARVIALPCREWNACQDDWAHIGPECRMLHVKGTLRWAVLGDEAIAELPSELRRGAELWREARDAAV